MDLRLKKKHRFFAKKKYSTKFVSLENSKPIETNNNRNFTSPSAQLYSVRNGDFV